MPKSIFTLLIFHYLKALLDGGKMKKIKFFALGATVIMLLVALVPIVSSISLEQKNNNQEIGNVVASNGPSADLKIRKGDGDWVDQQLTCNVGTKIEFKINAESKNKYYGVIVRINLPIQNNNPEDTMFRYIKGSASPVPDPQEGGVFGSDGIVLWMYDVSKKEFWSEEMRFRAELVGSGSGQINLEVLWVTEKMEIDSVEDSVGITGEKDKNKNCFFEKTIYGRQIFQILRYFVNYHTEDLTKTLSLNSSIVTNSGGVNKWEGPFYYAYWFPPNIGQYFKIWLDDETTKSLEYADLILILIGALGWPIGVIVAIYIKGNLIPIQLANEGNGVTFRLHFPYFPSPAPWVGYIKPQ